MKKTLLAFLIPLLFPLTALASITVPWSATSTDVGYISPSLVNGNNPNLYISGSVGIGTTSPMSALSVVGNVNQYGAYAHYGLAAPLSQCNTALGASSCLELVGNDNTTGGVGIYEANINNGASAYGGYVLTNDLTGNATTNYSGVFLKSSRYSDTTFGTANAIPSLLALSNSMGPVSIQSFATTSAYSYIAFNAASAAAGSGPSISTEGMRLTSTGLGIGTIAPTNSLTLGSTGTGIALYNTADQTTNFERALIGWNQGGGSNIFSVGTLNGGTGTIREVRIGISATNGSASLGRYLSINGGSGTGLFAFQNSTASNINEVGVAGALNSSSGIQTGIAIINTFTQTSTAGYTGLAIKPTETTLGSGSHLLIQAGTSTAPDLFDVTNLGVASSTGLNVTGNEFVTGNTTWYGLANAAGSFLAADTTGKLIATTSPGTTLSGTIGQFPYYAGSGTTLTATSSIILATSGNVGISSTTPAQTLSVGGNLFIGASASGGTNGTLTYGGITFANTTTGTGSLVGSIAPTFTGNANGANLILSGALTSPVDGGGTTASSNLTLRATNNSTVTTGGSIKFQTFNATEAMTLLSTGLFGISSTTPWRTLDVNGTVGFKGLTTSSGLQTGVLCISAQNEVINDSVACLASARRFKQDINTLSATSSLTELMAIEPVSYYYKPSFNGALQSNPNYSGQFKGFVADDVGKIDPTLIEVETATTTSRDASLNSYPGMAAGLKIDNMVAVLWSAVQEIFSNQQKDEATIVRQQAQIDSLQKQINALKK